MFALADIEAALIRVIVGILDQCGLPPAAVTAATKPTEDLEKFDSKLWLVALGILSKELGVRIPNNRNIFMSTAKEPYTIRQASENIRRLLAKTGVAK